MAAQVLKTDDSEFTVDPQHGFYRIDAASVQGPPSLSPAQLYDAVLDKVDGPIFFRERV